MKVEPQKEHHWLQKLVGEWTYKVEAKVTPGELPKNSTGIETVRSLNGIWIQAEGRSEISADGEPSISILTLGYDPQQKRYVGTWIGSMMTYLWIYDGTLDATQTVLTLDTEGPGMSADAQTAKYRDIVEFKSDDHRLLTAQILGKNGEWQSFMTTHYHRKK